MPEFPGMGYPLVPGYEAVGRVVDAGSAVRSRIGDFVFVPGSSGFSGVRSLFGAASSHLVTPSRRAVTLDAGLDDRAILIALAATAHHAVVAPTGALPELIVGHGVLGRLMARIVVALGGPAPTVWETSPARMGGHDGYAVMSPDDDQRRDYARICEASGDPAILDRLTPRLAHGGEIVIAGFYDRLSFAFPTAFMKEATFRVAAEWRAADLEATVRLVDEGRLSLDGLLTHSGRPRDAAKAYRQAFGDPDCLKMTIDWRNAA